MAEGIRLYLEHEGRELTANVAGYPPSDPQERVDVTIEVLEDGNTGESVPLIDEIKAAFKRQYILEVIERKNT